MHAMAQLFNSCTLLGSENKLLAIHALDIKEHLYLKNYFLEDRDYFQNQVLLVPLEHHRKYSPEDKTFVQIFHRYGLQLVRNVSTEAFCQKKVEASKSKVFTTTYLFSWNFWSGEVPELHDWGFRWRKGKITGVLPDKAFFNMVKT